MSEQGEQTMGTSLLEDYEDGAVVDVTIRGVLGTSRVLPGERARYLESNGRWIILGPGLGQRENADVRAVARVETPYADPEFIPGHVYVQVLDSTDIWRTMPGGNAVPRWFCSYVAAGVAHFVRTGQTEVVERTHPTVPRRLRDAAEPAPEVAEPEQVPAGVSGVEVAEPVLPLVLKDYVGDSVVIERSGGDSTWSAMVRVHDGSPGLTPDQCEQAAAALLWLAAEHRREQAGS